MVLVSTSTTTVRPATPKQAHWVRVKVADHTAAHPEKVAAISAAILADEVEHGYLTFDTAKASLDVLFSLPRNAPQAPEQVAPTGLHLHDGTVYKVQVSQTGNRYAKQLVADRPGEKGSWEYVGRGPLNFLSPATALTLESAKAFGLQTGVCAVCGLTLTDPKSVEQGIGPVCIKKFR